MYCREFRDTVHPVMLSHADGVWFSCEVITVRTGFSIYLLFYVKPDGFMETEEKPTFVQYFEVVPRTDEVDRERYFGSFR